MCGVIARWGPPGDREALHARISAGLAAIGHRGPDGSGIWIGDGVALGHARLAVIDLEGGAQPISHGEIHAVVNGELYGFEAQRAELASRGHVFRTRSDSEVLVHLYEEHGDDLVRHLRGEYAFVLWDARQRRLLASRDRFGIKPLVWARHGDELWFASEAKALFAAGLPAAWDATAMRQALYAQYLAPARTLFAGIHELLPGTTLVAAPEITVQRGPALPSPRDELAIVDDLRGSLEDAVVHRLRADVPVAAYLSGGLDSSLVVALAARHAPITAFGIAFDRAPYDEHREAAAFARSIGVPFHPVHVSQDAILEQLPEAVFHAEGLCINGQLTAKFLLSRAVREAGFKVVLAGEGADEVCFGYAHLVREALELANDVDRLAALDAQHATQAGIMLPVERDPALPVWLDAKRGIGRAMRSVLAEGVEPADPLAELDAELPADPLARSRDLWVRFALAKYILRTLGDGTEMAHGIEGRLPYLDPHVVAAAHRATPAEHLAGGVAKRLLRDAARGSVPESLRVRPKQPLLAPPITTGNSQRSSDLIHDVVRGSALRALPWFDRDRVIAWVDALPALAPDAARAAEPILMTILSACALQQRFHL
jgi:asparagine synthase (glutamine-hydrolysing)